MTSPRNDPLPRASQAGWALALAGLWLVGVPARLQADIWPFGSTAQKQQQIRMRSATERARLARNLTIFESLTPEQRAHYRQLKAELEEDRRHGGGLDELLDRYCKWLATLAEADREKLRSQKNLSVRAEMVRRMIENQPRKEPNPEAKEGQAGGKELPAVVAQDPAHDEVTFAPDDPYLSSQDLAAVMAVYEKALLATPALKPPDKERLQQKQGVDRYLLLLTFYPRREPGKKDRWLTDTTFREMVSAIGNSDQRRKIQSDETFVDKNKDFTFLIRRGIHKVLEAEIEADIGRRQEIFDKLNYDDQTRIKDVPRDKQPGAIAAAYIRQLLRGSFLSMEELRKHWLEEKRSERDRNNPARKK